MNNKEPGPIKQWFIRLPRRAAIVLTLGALFVLVVRAPDVFSALGAEAAAETDQTSAQRQVLLLLFGGILAAVTAFLSWKRHGREQQALQIERDRHWTGRYTEAVSQLGEPSTTINYGGIFALQRLAVETEELRDAQMVGNVLCAYVRDRAGPAHGPTGDRPERGVTAAFQALGEILEKHMVKCDLSQTHLENLELSGQRLTGADFTGAYLGDAELYQCSLSFSEFNNAILTDAYMVGANLRRANFKNADLTGAVLAHTNLVRSLLTRAKLDGADLRRADLRGARGWKREQFEAAAKWDVRTEWPEGFTPSTVEKGNQADS